MGTFERNKFRPTPHCTQIRRLVSCFIYFTLTIRDINIGGFIANVMGTYASKTMLVVFSSFFYHHPTYYSREGSQIWHEFSIIQQLAPIKDHVES